MTEPDDARVTKYRADCDAASGTLLQAVAAEAQALYRRESVNNGIQFDDHARWLAAQSYRQAQADRQDGVERLLAVHTAFMTI